MAESEAALDWDTIRQEYEAGHRTVVSIARQHGCSESAIRMRAKRHGWTRELSRAARKEGRARAFGEVTKQETPEPPSAEQVSEEENLVERYGQQVAEILRAERDDLRTARSKIRELFARLHNEAASFGQEIQGLDTLVKSVERVINLERKVYDLDEPDSEGEDTLAAFLQRIDGETYGPPKARGDLPPATPAPEGVEEGESGGDG